MKGQGTCKKCGKMFNWRRAKNQVIPMFCSMKCRGHTGFRPGSPLFISEMNEEQKFERLKKSYEKHVIRQESCWDWKGSISNNGYPVMSCRRTIGADRGHKASWIIHNGPIPEGMHVCHSCDNRKCTNPEHLWIGTHKQNNDDKIAKGRAKYVQPPVMKGEANPSAKLTEAMVKEIKCLLELGHSSYGIAKKFSVSKTTILRIKRNTHWKHIEEQP